MGNFQNHIYKNEFIDERETKVIFDIGANCGVISLFFAHEFSTATIHAFEPTNYAIKKFRKNLELNPDLAEHIRLNQFYVSENSSTIPENVYSSWPLSGNSERHDTHGGVLQSAENASSISVDNYVRDHNLDRVDLIKIDTDGHEYEVLNGALETINKLKPLIIFEIGQYMVLERNLSFQQYYQLFEEAGYKLYTVKKHQVQLSNYKNYIPRNSTVDLFAIPITPLSMPQPHF